MNVTVIVAVSLAALLVIGQSTALFLLLRAERRTVSNHEEIAQRLDDMETVVTNVSAAISQAHQQAPSGLSVGTPAPAFTLPDLAGRERHLSDFLGHPLILTFFSTGCGYCQQMAPRLGQLPKDAPRILLVSRGDSDEHLKLAAENKWQCDVVLESSNVVMTAYQTTGTPTGYLVDSEGLIASELAVGADAVLGLIGQAKAREASSDLTIESLRQKKDHAAERARAAGLAVRSSTLQRDGLAPGTPAPDFLLPDLSGQERRLTDYRNKRVLLVFSEPGCGPCEALAPELVRLQRRHSNNNLQIVVVSRGDHAANEQKAKQFGFTFPVLLQKRWEVSKDYAMFATPVGYLIDEKGVIAKSVAVGKSAILELV